MYSINRRLTFSITPGCLDQKSASISHDASTRMLVLTIRVFFCVICGLEGSVGHVLGQTVAILLEVIRGIVEHFISLVVAFHLSALPADTDSRFRSRTRTVDQRRRWDVSTLSLLVTLRTYQHRSGQSI